MEKPLIIHTGRWRKTWMDCCCCYGTKNSALLVLVLVDMELLLQLHSHSAIASSLGKKENQSDQELHRSIGKERKRLRTQAPLVCETLIGRESGREKKRDQNKNKNTHSKIRRIVEEGNAPESKEMLTYIYVNKCSSCEGRRERRSRSSRSAKKRRPRC